MTRRQFKALRLKLGLSQREYGELYGFSMPQQRVSEIELGTIGISNQVAIIYELLKERTLKDRKKP
ncbi:MAG: helix-turn-helix domain-containing protein [Dehalococcoidia bacterium]